MRIAVTGSIATDHLMMFAGKFTDTLIAEKLDKISVSFLVGDLQIRRGGVAGNISYGLGCLGLKPLLVGSVGQDFAEYASWLTAHGVDISGVRTSETRHTARFTATNDETGNQIASFYPGAMSEDGEIDIVSLASANAVDLVVIGAGDPVAMQRFTADCRAAGLRFAADFSQQVAFLDGESMRTLIEGAAYLFCQRVRGRRHRAEDRLDQRGHPGPSGDAGRHPRLRGRARRAQGRRIAASRSSTSTSAARSILSRRSAAATTATTPLSCRSRACLART